MARQKINASTQLSANATNARQDFTATASQTVFNVSPNTFDSLSLEVYVGGALLRNVTDYTIDNTMQVTLAVGVASGILVTLAWKNPSQNIVPAVPAREDFVATALQTTFTPAQAFTLGQEWVYKNGRVMRYGASYDYLTSGNSIVFNAGLALDDKVTIIVVTNLSTGGIPSIQVFAPTAGQTTFQTGSFVTGQERVYLNGARLVYGAGYDYTVTGGVSNNYVVTNSPLTIIDVLVVELIGGTPTFGPAIAQWVSVTVDHAQFAAAALTDNFEIYSLPAGYAIHGAVLYHTTSFTGGSVSAFTVSLGVTGNATRFTSAFDVFQATAGDTGLTSPGLWLENYLAATSVKAFATSVGGNVNTTTQGTLVVKLLVSQAV